MKRAFVASGALLLTLLIFATGCRSGGDPTQAETQREFGVRMARMNLWREAMFRFRRQVEIDPSNARAHNNLAVAAEANGDYDAAAKEYREALRLDRSNQYIQKNYSRFVEFMQKSRKRDEKEPASPAAADRTQTPATAVPPPPSMPDASSGAPPETSVPPPPSEPPPSTNPHPSDGGRP